MSRGGTAAKGIVVLLLTACGPRGYGPPPASPVPVAGSSVPYQVGLASYYHDSLAGNLTANGERYEPSGITAAHRTLPFGTVVDVVRRDGRFVRVRINDRGPFVEGRIVDLSRQAATLLDILREGVVEVGLFIVALPPPHAGHPTPPR